MFSGRHQNPSKKIVVRSKILQSFDHQRNTSFADWIYSHATLAILELQKVREETGETLNVPTVYCSIIAQIFLFIVAYFNTHCCLKRGIKLTGRP